MALRDLPGAEVWAISPDGKESRFGLYVYLPENTEKSNYPQIGMAVIQKGPTGDWFPMMAKKKNPKGGTEITFNPRVWCYVDTIPQLTKVLNAIHKQHRPGSQIGDAKTNLEKVLKEQKSDEELEAFIKRSGEFG